MNKNKYIKKAIIGTALGAIAVFGATATITAHSTPDDLVNNNVVAIASDEMDIDIATAKNAANQGYMYGYKKGEKDKKGNKKFNDKPYIPIQDSTLTPIVPEKKYQKIYEAGFKSGYEDGFNGTSKYGTVTKLGKDTGYSLTTEALNAAVGTTGTDKNGSPQ